MLYKEFLDLVCRLYENGIAKLFLDEQIVEVRWDKKNLTLITKIFTGTNAIPAFVADSLSSTGSLKWEGKKDEIYIDNNSGDLFYKRTLSPSLVYTYIRDEMTDYLEQVQDWKSHFKMRATKERFIQNVV